MSISGPENGRICGSDAGEILLLCRGKIFSLKDGASWVVQKLGVSEAEASKVGLQTSPESLTELVAEITGRVTRWISP